MLGKAKRVRVRLSRFCSVATVAVALSCAWARPQTQDLKGTVVSEKEKSVVGAICTLTGRTLPDQGLSVTTGEPGEFHFPGLAPGIYDLVCAAVGYEPVAQKDLEVTEAGAPTVQMVLPAEIRVRQKINVHAQAGTVSQQSSAPPAALATQQLRVLPLTEQKFKAALPLVPGVVRTPDGKINIKGSVESQGMLLVDSAEMVDPVTGAFSIEVPIDAVESLEVYKSAYRAEYGRFSGGLTSVQTKAPSGQRHIELNDFLPTLRVRGGHIVGIADDKPRLNFTTPILRNKLNLAESLTYDLAKQPVRGLAWPHNETKREGYNSFTNFQYLFSASHLLTTSVNLFPMKKQFADISSLVPQSASSDYAQRGFSITVTDRYLFASGVVLTTLAQYTKFSSDTHGQGPADMLVTPNGRLGNFFNAWNRSSAQKQLLETIQAPPRQWLGRHDFKFGVNFVNRAFTGSSSSHPVMLLRADGSPAEQIRFRSPTALGVEDTEVGTFAQDHWALNDRLALDVGVRYAAQTLGEVAAIAPRFGWVYSPDDNGKTIFRGGVGIFYDRLPLLAGDFTHNPTRIVTLFDLGTGAAAQPLILRNRYEKIDKRNNIITPSRNHLDSTPHNLTWNVEVDRELRPNAVLRLSFLSSRTYDVFTVNPLRLGGNRSALLLSNAGGSRYREFESTLRLRPKEGSDLNFSYVYSLARGDLNTLGQTYVPFEQPVIRPNRFALLPSNTPHRLVAWGRFRVPWEVTLSPIADLRSGFPYSAVDVLQNYVGEPNSRKFPTFFSLDLQLTKDFRLPFIPLLKTHKLRGAFQIFNVTNHSNPRDVFDNVASPFFGQFVGFQHRFYDVSLDIVY